ncbi:hypothetical protein AVEN_257993-1 [Araneus ventricosus]|uniref:Tc1-like transposase DDE domain-containing protein n=1 Tax=Araneus ventricosus TaxID=182803 RepID=A0A4Y2G485_ARAVE|nr:hypothetical protein AVEN_257993-1 [Araneus ventricosus]
MTESEISCRMQVVYGEALCTNGVSSFGVADKTLWTSSPWTGTRNRCQNDLSCLRWEVFDHSPYSPDLSPFDCHMFGPLKIKRFVMLWKSDSNINLRPFSYSASKTVFHIGTFA